MIEFMQYGKRHKEKQGLELTSLIDMVFLLLIFFLLTSYYTKPTIPVVLPESETADRNRDSDIVIVVREDMTLAIEKRVVTIDDLPDLLYNLLHSREEKKINIQADKSVHFGMIVQIMDIAHKAGTDNIFFVVEKKE